MSGLNTVVLSACAAALIGSLASSFITEGGTKKIFTLVMGAFMVCAMIVPTVNAVKNIHPSLEAYPSYSDLTATADEAYQEKLIAQTRLNLEQTLTALLNQNGIEPQSVSVILSEAEERSIMIASVSIYIDESDFGLSDFISDLTVQHFGITPSIITELKMNESKFRKRLKALTEKGWTIRLMIIAGVVGIALIFFSSLDFGGITEKQDDAFSVNAYSEELESDLEEVIAHIQGAGKTKVLLTMENSVEYVYLRDSTTKTKEVAPLIRGVLVLCEGGDEPVVVERVTEAVTKALDLSAAKVCITKLSE